MNIITRKQAGLDPPKYVNKMRSMRRIFIHHTATLETASVKSIQKYHVEKRGWSDIAYSFLVDQHGNIYEGRGWGIAGGHTRNYNFISHAFCYIGNTMERPPTQDALESIDWLIAEAERRYGSQLVKGHRDVKKTSCPGDYLYNELPNLIAHKYLKQSSNLNVGSRSVITSTLKKGSKGDEVKTLQRILNTFNDANLKVDGVFGPATELAVMAYQKKLGVKPDGIWGPKSQKAQSDLENLLETLKMQEANDPKPSTLPSTKIKGDVLSRGSSGPKVKALQEALVKLGVDIAVDGIFGPKTEKAVSDLQAFFKVTEDPSGVVGEHTMDLIDYLVATKEKEEAEARAKEAAEAAAAAKAEAERQAAEALAKQSEKERAEAIKASQEAAKLAAEAIARAEELQRELDAMQDIYERDDPDYVKAELERLAAENKEQDVQIELNKSRIKSAINAIKALGLFKLFSAFYSMFSKFLRRGK